MTPEVTYYISMCMTYNLSFRYHVGMTAKVEVLQINNIVNRKLKKGCGNPMPLEPVVDNRPV